MRIKKIGMRNIKTAIAVVISMIISKLLNMEYPFYTVIASIISMQSSVEASFKAGRNRMLGTLIGALIGFILSSIMPGNIILIGIGIVAVIYICNIFNWEQSTSIACVVFCAIMINLKGGSPFFYSVNRLVDTFIGITVAVGVNYFIAPPKSYENTDN
ncbi:FUSC family protein [Clostridium sp. YIM B02515]|uniref:FUSC family protein n=1 Tax=Clostridium rhizosphaerae TaxID=2803861 RepID=A0ABS1TBD2_9CLOT|nr:FUSC family protein [Clostridium rhizosphaerae]